MSAPSVTYRFVTGTLISEKEHNQNNADLLAAISDGTKDLSILSISTTNNMIMYGDLSTIGSSSSDTVLINAVLNTDIKAASTSVNVGSTTLPWSALYLDNGATDGGAIYFGSTSKYMKATADGTELDHSGFDTYDYQSKIINNFGGTSNTDLNVSGNVTVSNRVFGARQIFNGYGVNQMFGSTQNFLAAASGGDPTAEGFIARANGSLSFATVRILITSYVSSGDLTMYVYKNGSLLVTIGTNTITANGAYNYSVTASRGDYTFSQGDILSIYGIRAGSSSPAGHVLLGVYYDS